MKSRYDGWAEWYDAKFAAYAIGDSSSAAQLRRMLGPGQGWCLDIGCGTGLHFDAIAATGRRVIGVDISSDQLTLARRRHATVALGNAQRLPFASASFDTVTATYLHTDIDDIAAVFAEASRVMRGGGRFVYLGTHPCFVGHFVEFREEDGGRVVHAGYHESGWHMESPFFSPEGVRARVGYRHVPLAELVNGLVASGLRLLQMEEPSPQDPPGSIAFIATKDRTAIAR